MNRVAITKVGMSRVSRARTIKVAKVRLLTLNDRATSQRCKGTIRANRGALVGTMLVTVEARHPQLRLPQRVGNGTCWHFLVPLGIQGWVRRHGHMGTAPTERLEAAMAAWATMEGVTAETAQAGLGMALEGVLAAVGTAAAKAAG